MANTLTEAFKVYRKTDPEDAVRCLSTAIQHYTQRGNFRRAATHQNNLAEVYEIEIGDQKKALEAFETSATWFESDGAEALANKLWLKTADIAALEGDYSKATDQFEKVAKTSINNNLMRWSVKDYLLKAGICHLASAVRIFFISLTYWCNNTILASVLPTSLTDWSVRILWLRIEPWSNIAT